MLNLKKVLWITQVNFGEFWGMGYEACESRQGLQAHESRQKAMRS